MSDWLSTRLTPAKAKEARWVELSQVLEQVWEEFFDPELSRLERLRSCYLADDVDLIKQIRQMGDYFSFDRPNREDRPISLSWRRLELEYKDMELILGSVFRRHYSNLPVTWFPIFAPKEEVYGVGFEVAEGPWPERKNQPPEGMFLTSRGRLGTDYGYLMTLGLNKQEFLEKALPLLKRTKPLHIVYDGALWYIWFDIFFQADNSTSLLCWERESGLVELQFSVLGSRFDHTWADVRYVDIQSALCQWDRNDTPVIPFIPENDGTWHLDFFLPEGFPENWLPLDVVIAGREYAKNPLAIAAFISSEYAQITLPTLSVSFKHDKNVPPIICTGKPANIVCGSEVENKKMDLAASFHGFDYLDHFPRFDDFPIDKFPLDMPIGGAYA